MGRRRAENENEPSVSATPRLWKATAIATTTKSRKSIRPLWPRKLNCTWAWTTPITKPAMSARGKDTMPAMTAAASARVMVLGPRLAMPVSAPRFPDSRSIDTLDSRPATVQTNSWTILGSMPDIRARSAFDAEAWTVCPNTVRFRNQARPKASTGTTMRMVSFGPVIRSPNTSSQVKPSGTGNRLPLLVSMSGRAARTACMSWASPMVATSTMTRGASNRRRMTARSTAAPMTVPVSSAMARAAQ